MRRWCLAFFALTCSVFFSSCATIAPMPLSSATDTVGSIGKPIFLMSATLRNTFRPLPVFQPKLSEVFIDKGVGRKNEDTIVFRADSKGSKVTNSPTEGNSYLLRLALDPGDYIIRGLFSFVQAFNGTFFAPLQSNFVSNEPGVYYLGHVDAVIREKREGEFRAGKLVPLLDQTLVGAIGGTFDIDISDEWSSDESRFRATFPALANANIKKRILPPFDRQKAQRWWDSH